MNKYSEVEIHDFGYLQIEMYLLVEIWLNMASFSIYRFIFPEVTIQSWSEIVLATPKRVRA